MDDVIRDAGYKFGANELIILSQLSLAAVPTAAIIFLDVVTSRCPTVCVVEEEGCTRYEGDSTDMCKLTEWQWRYEEPMESVQGQFDLLCQGSRVKYMSHLLFYIGMFLSCMLAGLSSDAIGRKKSLMMFLLVECVGLVLMIVVDTFIVWLAVRFITGLGIGYFVVSQILIIEGLKVEFRHWFLAAIWGFYSVGLLLLGLLELAFTRYIDMIACVLILVGALWGIYLFGIEESLRWLLVKQKAESAQYILHKIAYRNNVELPSYEEIPKLTDDQFSVVDLVVIKQSRYLLMILLAMNIVSYYLYSHAITYSYPTTPNADYVMLLMTGGIGFIGVLATSVSCCYLGRRSTVVGLLLLELVTFCVQMFAESEVTYTVCSNVFRLLVPGLLYCCSLYSLEAYATPLRAKAVGVVMSAAALGGVLSSAKLIYNESMETAFTLQVVLLIATTLTLLLALSLPETKGRPLPDQVDNMPGLLGVKQWCSSTVKETTPLLRSS